MDICGPRHLQLYSRGLVSSESFRAFSGWDGYMSATLKSTLDALASLAMISASVFLVVLATRVERQGELSVLRPYQAGDDLTSVSELKDFDDERWLLMWIQSTCQYCTASLPFYGTLARDGERSVRIVAAGVEPEDTIRQYLRENGIEVDRVVGAPADVRLFATPTLLLVGRGLIVESVWVGQLTRDDEDQVRRAIGGS